jgi:prophage regulatory protein
MAAQLRTELASNGFGESDPIDTFMRLAAVMRVTGLGRSTIYDLMAADPPLFPRSMKIGNGKAVAWSAFEILQWQRDRIAARDASPR